MYWRYIILYSFQRDDFVPGLQLFGACTLPFPNISTPASSEINPMLPSTIAFVFPRQMCANTFFVPYFKVMRQYAHNRLLCILDKIDIIWCTNNGCSVKIGIRFFLSSQTSNVIIEFSSFRNKTSGNSEMMPTRHYGQIIQLRPTNLLDWEVSCLYGHTCLHIFQHNHSLILIVQNRQSHLNL